MISHRTYIKKAIELAAKGKGKVSPNPVVGAIIVKRGKIIGKGYHGQDGKKHAEIIALEQAKDKAKNATLYITLEPCSHWGKTPPCTDAIINAGIREVVVGLEDPNPLVDGINILKGVGIKVKKGILEDEVKKLNEFYLKLKHKKMPFITIKAAISLDGKIATKKGKSKYISSKQALKYCHDLRNEHDAILIGINTAIKDNPLLNVRFTKGRDPLKVVLDSKLRLPLTSNLVKKNPEKLIIATSLKPNQTKLKQLEKKGVKVLKINKDNTGIDLKDLLKELGKHNIASILVEGGAIVLTNFIKKKLADKCVLCISPIIIGKGKDVVDDLDVNEIAKAVKIKNSELKKFGQDICIEGYF